MPVLGAVLLLLGYTLARPGPALVGLAGVLLLSGRAEAQRPTAGSRAMAAGDPARAAAEFLKEAGSGTARDTAFYNAGTAALEARRYEVARGALEEAAKSLDPDLRYRALYNLGLVDLLAAEEADSSKRGEMLAHAEDRLREALRLQPSSPRAKWNLELAERRQPPPPPSGGGGGGGGPPPPAGGGAQPPPARPEPQSQGLSQSQAEQILNSMERRERQTRAEQQRRLHGGSAGGVKDW
jgi:tetratricopeptide (TPR) repeat protein